MTLEYAISECKRLDAKYPSWPYVCVHEMMAGETWVILSYDVCGGDPAVERGYFGRFRRRPWVDHERTSGIPKNFPESADLLLTPGR